jgi:hypothetical protein
MSQRKLGAFAIAFGAAALLVLGVVGGASADVPKVTVGGHVTLTFSPPGHFEGKVTSPRRACRRNRRATLNYWMMPSGPVDHLDSDRTNATGKYEIDIEPFATEGDYQTRVGRKVVHKPDLTIICKPVLSVRHHF